MAEYRQNPAPQKRTANTRRPQSGNTTPDGYLNQNQASRGQNPSARAAHAGAYRAYTPTDAKRVSHNHSPQFDNGKKKKGGGPWRAVFWIALIVFLVSLIALGVIGFSYLQGQNTYKEVAEIGFTPPEDHESVSLADMQVDWDALLAQNPDTVGWIYIPGTVINYPIVHTTDNEKYLTADFTGTEGWLANFGAIFLAAENKGDFSDPNNIIYGHHIYDGSMFAAIDTFRDENEFNSHRTIYLLTPQGNYRLTSFSLVICDGNDPLAQPTFVDDAEMISYIQDKIDRNVVNPNPGIIAASEMNKIFAFVTCDYTINDGRAVLFASVTESTVESAAAEQQEQGMVNPDDVAAVEDASKEIE